LLSITLFGAWAWVVYVTLSEPGWNVSMGFPAPYYVTAIGSGVFALLAKLGKPAYSPKANVASVLGLIAVVIGSLSFGSGSISITQSFWITVVGLVVTLLTLPLGWGSDATLAAQTGVIKNLEAELLVKNEVIEALWIRSPKPEPILGLVVSAVFIAWLGAVAQKTQSKKGVGK
jgi:energy-converting hydrogenase Eha subunit A